MLIAGALVCLLSSVDAREKSSRFTRDEIDEFLAYHNKIRREQGAVPVVWDPKLASYAQQWADKLAQLNKLQHRPNNPFGENLYVNVGGRPGVLDAARAWTSERKYYSGELITEQNFMKFGHYTQMIWGSTERIGAGKVRTKSGRFYVCCDYDPPGNVVGQVPITKRYSGGN